jgi:hypothetical protein
MIFRIDGVLYDVLVGYMGAPPTMTVIAANTGAAANGAAQARPAASSVARRAILAFMFGSVVIFVPSL